MPRAADIPSCPAIPGPVAGNEQNYEIELITPLFGGGVQTRETDPSFPIRPTAIRGHLQFWWRATVGAKFSTKKELRAEQTWLWGGASGEDGRPSRVQVRVELVEADTPVACAGFERDSTDQSRYRSMPDWKKPFADTDLPYALFPFQGQMAKGRRTIEVAPAKCI
ncbi:MAG: type III-B CRISPR module RAMP protein Cmr1, partial [Gemmataceae bacterium]|nr:type III-B CRISPR module RAMP protein Cmr1 [Gemmataceae bacterium]